VVISYRCIVYLEQACQPCKSGNQISPLSLQPVRRSGDLTELPFHLRGWEDFMREAWGLFMRVAGRHWVFLEGSLFSV
jgi:hypothetical protein